MPGLLFSVSFPKSYIVNTCLPGKTRNTLPKRTKLQRKGRKEAGLA